MQVYAALLRGINVGGNKKVSMPVLKAMLESMGFGHVRTSINSGNAVLMSDGAEDPDKIWRRLWTTTRLPPRAPRRSSTSTSD